jgi:hypothetical protein
MKTWRIILIILVVFIIIGAIVLVVSICQSLSTDQVLSLTQVVIEAALVPIAVFGFAITIREFSKSQGNLDIRLEFEELTREGYSNRLDVGIPETGGKGYSIPVAATNSSPIVAIWWQIHFVVPRYLDKHPPMRISNMFAHEELGGVFTTIAKDDGYHITFLSNGLTALFQNVPLELGKLHFTIHSDFNEPREYSIPYSVITDRGEPIYNELIIKIHSGSVV